MTIKTNVFSIEELAPFPEDNTILPLSTRDLGTFVWEDEKTKKLKEQLSKCKDVLETVRDFFEKAQVSELVQQLGIDEVLNEI